MPKRKNKYIKQMVMTERIKNKKNFEIDQQHYKNTTAAARLQQHLILVDPRKRNGSMEKSQRRKKIKYQGSV